MDEPDYVFDGANVRYVEVKWIDSGVHIDEGWAPIAKYIARAKEQDGLVTTTGVLIHLDPEIVVVGLSVDQKNDTVFGAQVIVRKNVEGFRYLS